MHVSFLAQGWGFEHQVSIKGGVGSDCWMLCTGIVCDSDDNGDSNSHWHLLCVDKVPGTTKLVKVIYTCYFT